MKDFIQIFFLVIGIFLFLIDFYLYQALNGLIKIKSKGTNFAFYWWGASILMLSSLFLDFSVDFSSGLRAGLAILFFLTLAAKLWLTGFVILDDLSRAITWLKQKIFINSAETRAADSANPPISRSEFLIKAGILTATIPFGALGHGAMFNAYDYRVRRHTLYLPNLPKAFDGLVLGQLSDIHAGSFYNPKAVLRGVELLLKEKPDVVFFTGDLVNNLASEMRNYQDIFSKIKAPLGVFSVLGNHDYGDYYFGKVASVEKTRNFAALKATHKNMGWDLLINEHRKLRVGGEEIAIIGVENWGKGRFLKYGRLDLAVQGTDDAPVKLLLSHDPSHWKAQVVPLYPQIDVMFSGHTHGMQLGVQINELQWSPIQYVYKEWAGLYHEQHQQLYVNVGFGFIRFPGRVGILPEIACFELRQGKV